MTIIDITKEMFSTEVYPGDPIPNKREVLSFNKAISDICQVTELTLGSHTGTHLDAPLHFVPNGCDVAKIDLEKCIGKCYVIECDGILTREYVTPLINRSVKKLLFKGNVGIDSDMATYLVENEIECLGVEMSTVATGEHQVNVHRILLGAKVVIIENLDLRQVAEGEYFLCACPLKMDGLDGSPVRAILYKES